MQIQREIKMMLIGDTGVGKSATIVRFAQNLFCAEYDPTIQDNYRKSFQYNGNSYLLDILDTVPSNYADRFWEKFIPDSEAIAVFYSVDSLQSFESLDRHLEEIELLRSKHKQSGFRNVVIVGSKCDIDESMREVSTSQGMGFAEMRGFAFLEISAKEGVAVDTLFSTMTSMAVEGVIDMPVSRVDRKSKSKSKCLVM